MSLTIKLPASRVRRQRLARQLGEAGLSLDSAQTRLQHAWPVAGAMLDAGFNVVEEIMELPRDRRERAFNDHSDLVHWFGEIERPRQARTVHKRLAGIRRRYGRNVTVALKPDRFKDDDRRTPAAQTAGAANVTKQRMRVYTTLIARDIWEVAEVLVHELGHHWFTDQKLEKVKVYGERRARDLAKYNPRKARRSTENYAIFCARRHEADGLRADTANVFGSQR